jgi:hypothetical protein
MFSTANAMPVDSSSAAMPLTKSRAYSFCQRNGGCTTTTSAPTATAISAERWSFPHGSVPHTRCVNSRHGAWIAETGTSWCCDSCCTALIDCDSASITITSTAS